MEIKKFNELQSDDLVPKGWVNIKIDNQIFIRMSRYVDALDSVLIKTTGRKGSINNLEDKLKLLARIDSISEKNATIQEKISLITLLQYLYEIKKFFDPSSSGYLLEGFIGSLLYADVLHNKSGVDISQTKLKPEEEIEKDEYFNSFRFKTAGSRGIKGITYQVKLYSKKGQISISMKDRCDFYVICLKSENERIEVYILSGDDKSKRNPYILDCAVTDKKTESKLRHKIHKKTGVEIPYCVLSNSTLETNCESIDIELNSIGPMIQSLGADIQNKISVIYDDLSELHFDVDAIISGRDKHKNSIPLEKARKMATSRLSKITDDIQNFKF